MKQKISDFRRLGGKGKRVTDWGLLMGTEFLSMGKQMLRQDHDNDRTTDFYTSNGQIMYYVDYINKLVHLGKTI